MSPWPWSDGIHEQYTQGGKPESALSVFCRAPPTKDTDAWVTVFCEVTEGDFSE